jgi:hypothetical protein
MAHWLKINPLEEEAGFAMQRKNPPLLKRVFIFEVLTFISNYG